MSSTYHICTTIYASWKDIYYFNMSLIQPYTYHVTFKNEATTHHIYILLHFIHTLYVPHTFLITMPLHMYHINHSLTFVHNYFTNMGFKHRTVHHNTPFPYTTFLPPRLDLLYTHTHFNKETKTNYYFFQKTSYCVTIPNRKQNHISPSTSPPLPSPPLPTRTSYVQMAL
jgi:hypothetical protein